MLLATPLAAQDALDRTNPALQVNRDDRTLPPPEQIRIEILPVLDTPLPDAANELLDVGAIVIDGLTVLDRAAFAGTTEPFAGRPLERTELVQLTDAIAARLRAKGYILGTAWIPEQTLVGGMLRVRVDEGRIDALRIEGSDNPAIRHQLERLVNGAPVTLAALQREVLLADDLPGVWIRSTSEANGSMLLATDGTKPLGPVLARIDVDGNGLFSPWDRVDLSFSATPLNPGELAFFNARYSVVFNDAGTNIATSLSWSRTEPGAYLADRELLGKAWQGGISLRHPLIRSQSRSLWLEASGELQDLRQDSFGTLARADAIALARLGFYGFGPLGGGTLQGRATVSQGLAILGRDPGQRPARLALRRSARLHDAVVVAELVSLDRPARQPLACYHRPAIGRTAADRRALFAGRHRLPARLRFRAKSRRSRRHRACRAALRLAQGTGCDAQHAALCLRRRRDGLEHRRRPGRRHARTVRGRPAH